MELLPELASLEIKSSVCLDAKRVAIGVTVCALEGVAKSGTSKVPMTLMAARHAAARRARVFRCAGREGIACYLNRICFSAHCKRLNDMHVVKAC